jgi:hypothetical protein
LVVNDSIWLSGNDAFLKYCHFNHALIKRPQYYDGRVEQILLCDLLLATEAFDV